MGNKTSPPKEAVLNNAIFVSEGHQCHVLNLVQAEEERRMASCEKINLLPVYFSCGQTENQLPSVAVSIMDRCQVGHRMKKHPCSHCSRHIQF